MTTNCQYNPDTVSRTIFSGSLGDITSPFIQVLDESMCVIREDICDWLQRYVFSEANVPPLESASDLLERLKSGVWLARLAHKLHFKVLAANLPCCPRGVKVISREHKLYASLRGTGPSNALGQLTADNLPAFSQPLKHAADSRLSESDIATGGFGQTPMAHRSSEPAFATSVVGVRLRNHWMARGNISAFLAWCKDLGISQTVLFETTGLVNRTEEKNVLLTLMELARLASRFGLAELPELVRMEREIEALEAAEAATAETVTTAIMTTESSMKKINVGVYTARVADRKLNSSVCTNPTSSDCDSCASSVASTNTESGIQQSYSLASSDASAASTEVLVDVSVDAEEVATSIDGSRTESSTLVERSSSNGISSICTNTTISSDLVCDTSCQVNANNAVSGAPTATASTNTTKTSSTTVFVDLDDNIDDTTTTTISTASLPPHKSTAATITPPSAKPRGLKKPNPVPKSRLSNVSRIDSAKRSTSVADLRELANSRAKRRNTRDGQDVGVTARGRPVKPQNAVKTSTVGRTETAGVPKPRSRSQVRPPLVDREQVTDQIAKSQMPFSISTSSKLSSSGFGSHSSSCSDLAAEVKKQTAQCTCCTRNRLIRLDEGRYQMGSRIYYLRRFRSHVMVRVGGGWLTLSQFLDRYDPCRQKEGDFLNNGEPGSVIRVPASNIFKSWPSTEALKMNSQ